MHHLEKFAYFLRRVDLRLPMMVLLLCFSSVVCAQSMFKCKQADGAFSYQSDPCPQSSTQQVLQADGRGNIKVAPGQARSAEHNAAPPSAPAKPEMREAAKDRARLAPEPPSPPSQAQDAGVSVVTSDAPVEQEVSTNRQEIATALAIIGLGLLLLVWIWYCYTGGRFGDSVSDFIGGLMDIVLGTQTDDVQINNTNRSDPVMLWKTLALGILLLIAALHLGL